MIFDPSVQENPSYAIDFVVPNKSNAIKIVVYLFNLLYVVYTFARFMINDFHNDK